MITRGRSYMVMEEVVSQILEGVWNRKESTLNLSHRGIKVMPAEVGKLTFIKVLLLNNNSILMPPEEISHLSVLESLSLEYNQLTVIPSSIAQLNSSLHFLNLSHNPLTSLSPAVSQLENLRSLWLGHTGLVSFPEQILSMCNLQHLSLEGNSITCLSRSTPIGKLKELRWFSLAKNKLNFIEDTFSSLLHLHTLNLSDNLLTQIPAISCPTLSNLNLRDNKVSWLPDVRSAIKVLNQGSSSVKLDLRDNPIPQEKRPNWLQENVLL